MSRKRLSRPFSSTTNLAPLAPCRTNTRCCSTCKIRASIPRIPPCAAFSPSCFLPLCLSGRRRATSSPCRPCRRRRRAWKPSTKRSNRKSPSSSAKRKPARNSASRASSTWSRSHRPSVPPTTWSIARATASSSRRISTRSRSRRRCGSSTAGKALSVYTKVSRDELADWLQPLGLGELIDHVGIAAGMQNSNYFVTTARGRFVLTLFERIDTAALDFYLLLQDSLARQGIPCPQPVADNEGRYWRWLSDKPAALLTCLSGSALEVPGAADCHAVGEMLARLHLAAADMPNPLPDPCGAQWRQAVGSTLLPVVSAEERQLLADELAFQTGQDWSALPRGVIHADLFRDNVLWDVDGRLTGVLDFYFAGEDAWLFDLAVVANDWCVDDAALAALIDGYAGVRPLTEKERQAWPAMRRAAALRFWLLRLEVRHSPRQGEVVTIKNPDDFRRLLTRFRLAPAALPR